MKYDKVQDNKRHRFAIKEKVTNFGSELTPIISVQLTAQCNVPVRVNDLSLLKEVLTRSEIRTLTDKDLHI